MKTETWLFGFEEILAAAYADVDRPAGIHFLGAGNDFVYLDFKPSTGEVFYAGKGNLGRVRRKVRDNRHHANIVAKHGLSRFAFSVVDENAALAIEKRLVEAIGRLDLGTGPLVNFTDGGEGTSGLRHTDGTRARLSANAAMKRPEVKARHKAALADPEVKSRHKAGSKAAMNRPEVKAKVSGDNSPMKRPEVKAKISGDNNGMYGKTHTDGARAAIAAGAAAANTERKRLADELGIGFNQVTKSVLAGYRKANAK